MTLIELTGHASGIILYGGSTVAAVFWGDCDDDQIPILSPLGRMMPWNEAPGVFDDTTWERVEDWREVLPGSVWLTDEVDKDGVRIADTDLDIVYDDFNDILAAFMGVTPDGQPQDDFEAIVYTLKDGRKIIAPDMWQ